MRNVKFVDLYAGAGGTSTGVARACKMLGLKPRALAINHWKKAVETHAKNHPWAVHFCESLHQVNPHFDPRVRALFPRGIDLLVASPECTSHSLARGGKPMNDQSRAGAWHVLEWAQALHPSAFLVENVREWEFWGPLGRDDRPIKSKKGETFRAWLNAMKSLGYHVEYRVLNSADYGAATTRKRLFVAGVRDGDAIPWPQATHFANGEGKKRWRAAREVIDWDVKGQSIFSRKKPLSENTMRRILAGLKKFCGGTFVIPTNWGEAPGQAPRTHDIERPLPTVYAGGVGHAVIEPFLVQFNEGVERRVHSVDDPLPTVPTANRFGLAEPFIVPVTHGGGPNRTHGVDQPIPTVTGANRGELALVEPFIMQMSQSGSNGCRMRSTGKPLPTVTTADELAVVQPFLTKYYGTNLAASIEGPVPTVTAKDRFGLAEPVVKRDGKVYVVVDILFRMLQPHELALAMGFPKSYQFVGNRGERVRQVGNAVEVWQATALALELLSLIFKTRARRHRIKEAI